jgi:non-ribosomal peptide synthetase-like protein
MIPLPAVIFAIHYHVWELFSVAQGIGFISMFISLSTTSLLALSAIWFFGAVSLGLAAVYVIPRLCMMALRPGITYPNFGLHYLLQSIIQFVSNSQFFCLLFGDSSFIVRYMRFIGWNLNTVYQTGSNMGNSQRHDNPFLCNIGNRTMISDWLSMINMHMSATSFRLAESKIGDKNYLGNSIWYPPNGRTGTNVLIGTKTMIPIDGPVHENVGLLGSPAFEIPREVSCDRKMNTSLDERTRRARLHRKTLYNLKTALFFLASRWLVMFFSLVIAQDVFANFDRFGIFALFTGIWALAATYIAFFIFLERASLGFKRLQPHLASIYDPYFWWHERHWKLSTPPIPNIFAGTPFRGILLRAVGMKVGAKLFDCSQAISEPSLTEIGEYANLNEGCVLMAHSLEEGIFKSDYIRLDHGCSVGPGAFVHYGVSTGEHVVLDADSFLMKGEILDSHTGWCGNPAKMIRRQGVEAVDYVGSPFTLPVINSKTNSSLKSSPSNFVQRESNLATH